MDYLLNIFEFTIIVVTFLSFFVLNKASKIKKSKAFRYLAYGFLFQVIYLVIPIIILVLNLVFFPFEDEMDNLIEFIVYIPSLFILAVSAILFLLAYKQLKIENNITSTTQT